MKHRYMLWNTLLDNTTVLLADAIRSDDVPRISSLIKMYDFARSNARSSTPQEFPDNQVFDKILYLTHTLLIVKQARSTVKKYRVNLAEQNRLKIRTVADQHEFKETVKPKKKKHSKKKTRAERFNSGEVIEKRHRLHPNQYPSSQW